MAQHSNSSQRTLKRLGKVKPHQDFAVFDIEAREWIHVLAIGYFDGENYYDDFRNVDDFLTFLFSPDNQRSLIFAHFAGIYDSLFILAAALSQGLQIVDFLTRGSSLISLAISNGRRTLVFRDSGALLPFGLGTLTKTFEVKHGKLEADASRFTERTQSMLDYLHHDCLGLYEVLQAFYSHELVRNVPQKFTLASQALQVFRSYLTKDFPACPPSIDPFVRRGYAGGRVEIYRPLCLEPIHCLDFNSLFPAMMHKHPMPGQYLGLKKTLDLTKIGFAECDVSVPETYYPPLWIRPGALDYGWKPGKRKTSENMVMLGNTFLFPTGHLSGVWPVAELAHAVAQGVKILKVKHVAYFADAGPVFRDFIQELYTRRKNETDEGSRTIYKLMMNSVYGRMGIQPLREGLEFDSGQTGVTPDFEIRAGGRTYRMVRVQNELKSFSNVAVSAYTTAWARITQHQTLLRLDPVYYTDTDSFYVTGPEPESSQDLGELKYEYTEPEACFLLPKTYRVGTRVRMKGFDKKKTQHVDFATFKSALEGEMQISVKIEAKMLRLRGALRQGKILAVGQESVKKISARYNKRVLNRIGDTWDSRPWNRPEKGGAFV